MTQGTLSITVEPEAMVPPLETDVSSWQSTQDQGLKRLITTIPPFLLGTLAAYMGYFIGSVPIWAAHIMALWCIGGLAMFYALLRSGVTRTWRDPSLLFAQFLFSCMAVVISYVVIDAARSLALLWLCVVMLFEIHRLSGKQLMIGCLTSLMLMLASTLLHPHLHSTPIDLASEWISLATGAIVLPVIRLVSLRSYKMRTELLQQKATLASTVQKLALASAQDMLTGLPNRSRMQQLLDDEIRRLRRTEQPFCVAIIDLDHFKQINDVHGHGAGDTALKLFAKTAQAAIPATATLARWGGEEFLLLMPETCLNSGLRVLEDLRTAIHQQDWQSVAPGVKVTFSAGLCEPAGRVPVHRDLERADRALYKAKAEGRDRTVMAERT